MRNPRATSLQLNVWHNSCRMRCWRFLLAGLFIVFSLPSPLHSQAARDGTDSSVSFALDFPGSEPERYSISVQSDGHATYECSAKISPESDERETYRWEFSTSAFTLTRIFDLAAQAHYFAGKIDSGKRSLAFTGEKKLTYHDAQRDLTATYNYSNLAAVQQLTSLFQNLAATLEYGRRVAYFHRYQKLALDEELKRMETQAHNNELGELQAVREVLQRIVDDPSVINVVRARAQRLLDMGQSGASGGHSSKSY
jgi:hypothetical protein